MADTTMTVPRGLWFMMFEAFRMRPVSPNELPPNFITFIDRGFTSCNVTNYCEKIKVKSEKSSGNADVANHNQNACLEYIDGLVLKFFVIYPHLGGGKG
jgi:hypothetical protein